MWKRSVHDRREGSERCRERVQQSSKELCRSGATGNSLSARAKDQVEPRSSLFAADRTQPQSSLSAKSGERLCSHSAITSAIGALKGPLHGGANEAVFRVLSQIDSSGSDPVEYIRKMLEEKKKISGFGHRVYHTEDPRATHLRKMSEDLSRSSGEPKWFEMSRKIEQFVKAEKKLNANVDFYSASTYHVLGIDVDLFTPIFAVSRISGWSAHVIEQLDDNRLIRPRADYIGPAYPQHWVPIEKR